MSDLSRDADIRWPEIDPARCQGCGDCVPACPTGALVVVAGRAAVRPGAVCAYCADCEAICPRGAIRCAYEVVFADPAPGL